MSMYKCAQSLLHVGRLNCFDKQGKTVVAFFHFYFYKFAFRVVIQYSTSILQYISFFFFFVEEVVIAVDCGIDLFDSTYPFCFSTFQHIFLIQISYRDTDDNMAAAKSTAKDLTYKQSFDWHKFTLVQILAIKDTNFWSKQFLQ